MRGLRSWPPEHWFTAITTFAVAQNLDIHVVSQVREDESRTIEIARRLGVEATEWGTHTDTEQEGVARSLYARSKYVISDRMHVLVFATLAGAIPLEMAIQPTRKIRDHFGLIGIDGISIDVEGLPPRVQETFLEQATTILPTMHKSLDKAQSDLELHANTIRKAVERWRAPR